MLRDIPWSEITRYLEDLKRRRPPLAPLLEFHERVLEQVHQAPVLEKPLQQREGQLQHRNSQGLPLVDRREFLAGLDLSSAQRLFSDLASLLKGKGEVEEKMEKVERWLEAEAPRFHTLILEGLAEEDFLREMAEREGLDSEVLAYLFRMSGRPGISEQARRLAPFLEVDLWEEAYCPLCGSGPAFAELRGLEGKRYLYCSLCETPWPFRRLTCPFCGNEEPQELNYLYLEEDMRCLLQVCERCKGYLKTIDNQKFSGLIPFLEDLGSLHLDLIAWERGYRRGWAS